MYDTTKNVQPLVVAGASVRQDEEGRFCVNDLHRAAGKQRRHEPLNWRNTDRYKDLVAELETTGVPVVVKAGRYGGTYVCKELVYAYAMWISPQFHIQVIRAYDRAVAPKPKQPKPLDSERMKGELALLECFCTLNNPAPSSRTMLLGKIGQAHGLNTEWLPGYAEDGPEGHEGSMATAAATTLLKECDVRMSAASFNIELSKAGLLQKQWRVSRAGKTSYWTITERGQRFGKNITSPQAPRETQPHWYRDRFADLLREAGIEGAV